MTIRRYLPLLTGLTALAAMTSASAAPVLIDFTDSRWSGANGQTGFTQTYGDVDVTLSTSSGRLTFNAPEAPNAASPLALHGDGIGIGDDEISWNQSLNVMFSSGVTVLGYMFLDLFDGEGPDGGGERAFADFTTAGGGFQQTSYGTATDRVGFFEQNVEPLMDTTGAVFSVGGSENDWSKFSDFALAGIWIDAPVSVPEPETLGLMTLALAAAFAGGRGRRRTPWAG